MKKLFTFFALLAFVAVQAQITITNNDIAPAGTVIYMAYDTSLQVTPGPAGGERVWDFSALKVHNADTVSLLLPANTPYGGEFPMANFAVALESDGSFAYFNRNSSLLSNIGVAGDGGDYGFVITSMIPANIYLDFPVNYGNSRVESYYFNIKLADNSLPGVDSVRYKSTTEEQTTIDAWGTMTIPIGTFTVLRQKEEKIVYDSIWTRFFGNWLLISSGVDEFDTYNWWTNDIGAGFTLCTFDVDKITQEMSNITFLNSYTVGVNTLETESALCFPNPASNELRINISEQSEIEYVQVRDMSGVVISTPFEIGNGFVTLDVSELKDGLYLAMLRLQSGKSVSAKFLVRK